MYICKYIYVYCLFRDFLISQAFRSVRIGPSRQVDIEEPILTPYAPLRIWNGAKTINNIENLVKWRGPRRGMHYVLPIAYCSLPTAYCLLCIAYLHLPMHVMGRARAHAPSHVRGPRGRGGPQRGLGGGPEGRFLRGSYWFYDFGIHIDSMIWQMPVDSMISKSISTPCFGTIGVHSMISRSMLIPWFWYIHVDSMV